VNVTRGKIAKPIGYSVLLTVLLLIPLFIKDPYALHILIITIINIILGLSVRLILNVGQMTIATAAFMAVGGYTSALLVTRLGFSFWLTLPLAAVMAAIMAIAIGYLTLRLKGLYFALVTLAFTEVVLIVITHTEFLGGYDGITNLPHPNPLLGIEFASKTAYYYQFLLLGLVTAAFMYRIDKSQLGRILDSIRQSDLLCESIGINVMRYKVLAFTIGSVFASIVGVFQASYYSMVAPEFYTIWQSIYPLIYAQVGGVGSVAGPIVGAAFLTIVPEALRVMKELQPLILGPILIITILFLPGGLITLPQRIRSLAAKSAQIGGR